MIGLRSEIWKEGEYSYPAAYGFTPVIVSYVHEDERIRPCMLVVPGGGYRYVSSSEADPAARTFYAAGYNVFVLTYTVNYLDEPLKTAAFDGYCQNGADSPVSCRGMPH